MKSLEELQKELSEAKYVLTKAQDAVNSIKYDLAKHCPVKLGDVVEVNYFTNKGKKIKLDRIVYAPEYEYKSKEPRFLYKCNGSVIRKDGTLSPRLRGVHIC